jgi:hypothetical protein
VFGHGDKEPQGENLTALDGLTFDGLGESETMKTSNPFSRESRIMLETSLRAGLRLVEIDLETVDEFHNQTARYFQKRIEDFKKNAASRPDSYWEEDLGGGTTRGELASEERGELETLAQMNNRFGLLAAYAIFERCLTRIHQDMRSLKLVRDRYFD